MTITEDVSYVFVFTILRLAEKCYGGGASRAQDAGSCAESSWD
jgi:hypothetical protein